jgi:HEPN domain-containing protein
MKNRREHFALFELGCADFKLVERNLDDEEIKRQLLLFHLQQAVEKFLKSLLSSKNIRFLKIHDIEALIELCEENEIELPEYVEEFVGLTAYAVGFRYALIMEEISDLPDWYKKASEFKAFVERIINRD